MRKCSYELCTDISSNKSSLLAGYIWTKSPWRDVDQTFWNISAFLYQSNFLRLFSLSFSFSVHIWTQSMRHKSILLVHQSGFDHGAFATKLSFAKERLKLTATSLHLDGICYGTIFGKESRILCWSYACRSSIMVSYRRYLGCHLLIRRNEIQMCIWKML